MYELTASSILFRRRQRKRLYQGLKDPADPATRHQSHGAASGGRFRL